MCHGNSQHNTLPARDGTGAALRAVREEHGISNRELADRLSIDQSHLSRIETGKKTPSIETTAMILATLRTPPEERERILDLARNAKEPNWLAVGLPSVPQQLAAVYECERAASSIIEWHQNLVPGVLQTTEYTRAIAASALEGGYLPGGDSAVEDIVQAKSARGSVLARPNGVQFRALLSESVLRDPIGPPAVMDGQLRHLITMSGYPNVSIQVVPRDIGYHPGMQGPFILYEFSDALPALYFEHNMSTAFDQHYEDVDSYRKVIKALERMAMRGQDSVDLVARLLVGK